MIDNPTSTNSLSGKNAELYARFNRDFVDLISQRVGGETLSCSDDFFAGMESLLKAGRGVFIEDKYTDRGKWMDGWESRRSYGRATSQGKEHQYDWCVIRLGIKGKIVGFEIDTNYFRGNAPEFVEIEACHSSIEPDQTTTWTGLLAKNSVEPHLQNLFSIDSKNVWTHLRLKMFPDGGIARFRAYGEAETDWKEFVNGELIDLAAIKNGGKALLVSDMFFSDKNNLIMPGRGKDMGDGWETKRRRDPGPDWSIIKLADLGSIEKVIIDTCHFKGNYPDTFILQGIISQNDNFSDDGLSYDDCSDKNEKLNWQTIIPKTKLFAHREHCFIEQIISETKQQFTHVKLSIFPDGGISRMRVYGQPASKR